MRANDERNMLARKLFEEAFDFILAIVAIWGCFRKTLDPLAPPRHHHTVNADRCCDACLPRVRGCIQHSIYIPKVAYS